MRPPQDLASKPPRWFTREELRRIYEIPPSPFRTQEGKDLQRRLRWTRQLLANTGLRRGEALHLTWRDIGHDEIRVISEPEARTKSGRWRLVPISPGSAEAMEELKGGDRPIPALAPTSLSRCFAHAASRAGVEDASIHCLRHTYCSHLVQMGVPLRTVQILAGHASMATTERYAHLAPGHLQDAVSGLRL